MKDGLNTNLSYILNEHTVEEKEEEIKKKERSNGKYFFFSIFLIVLIYISTIFYDEIKTATNNLISKESVAKETIVPAPKPIIKEIEKIVKESVAKKTIEPTPKPIIKEVEKIVKESVAKKTIEPTPKPSIKEVEKIVKVPASKDELINIFNSVENFKSVVCTNYAVNRFNIKNSCKNKLEIFLTENKDAFRFEVTPYLGKRDVQGYLKYKDYLEDILMTGISGKRAKEIAIQMRQQLPENSIITINPYIKSEEQTSSVEIKAYH